MDHNHPNHHQNLAPHSSGQPTNMPQQIYHDHVHPQYLQPGHIATSPVKEVHNPRESLRTAMKALETATMAVKDAIRKPIAKLQEVPLETSRLRDTELALDHLIEATETTREFVVMADHLAEAAAVLAFEVEMNKEAMLQAVSTIIQAKQAIYGPEMRVTVDKVIMNLKALSR